MDRRGRLNSGIDSHSTRCNGGVGSGSESIASGSVASWDAG